MPTVSADAITSTLATPDKMHALPSDKTPNASLARALRAGAQCVDCDDDYGEDWRKTLGEWSLTASELPADLPLRKTLVMALNIEADVAEEIMSPNPFPFGRLCPIHTILRFYGCKNTTMNLIRAAARVHREQLEQVEEGRRLAEEKQCLAEEALQYMEYSARRFGERKRRKYAPQGVLSPRKCRRDTLGRRVQ